MVAWFKKIDRYLLTSSIKHKYLVKVKPFLPVKTVDMFDYVKAIERDLDPEAYVIDIGANDQTTDKNTKWNLLRTITTDQGA